MIESGLKPGETVVTDGHLRLVPGQPHHVKGQSDQPADAEGSVMNLSAIFIRRPVTTTLLMLGIIVFGVLAYLQLPGRRSPEHRLSDHPGQRGAARRQPRDDGLVGGAAAREAVRDDLRA